MTTLDREVYRGIKNETREREEERWCSLSQVHQGWHTSCGKGSMEAVTTASLFVVRSFPVEKEVRGGKMDWPWVTLEGCNRVGKLFPAVALVERNPLRKGRGARKCPPPLDRFAKLQSDLSYGRPRVISRELFRGFRLQCTSGFSWMSRRLSITSRWPFQSAYLHVTQRRDFL